MTTVRIGDHRLGPGPAVLIVAEVGINHNGDLDLARRMIDARPTREVDAVKLQNYRTEDFVVDRSLAYEYRVRGRPVVESQYDMFKRCELTLPHLRALKAHADARGVILFSTPTGPEALADPASLDVPVLKNGSDFLGHLPLIRAMAGDWPAHDDLDRHGHGGRDGRGGPGLPGGRGDRLVLLHCTSSYPTLPSTCTCARSEPWPPRSRVPSG